MASPIPRQVSAESKLRYGQSLADLLTARHVAHGQFVNDIGTATQSAQALQQASKDAVGQLKQIYNQADQARKDAAAVIGTTTGPGGALATALQAERAASGRRFAGERAAAQSDAVSRGSDAVAGLAYAKANALKAYRSNRAGLAAQERGLHSDMGLFAQTRTADLQAAGAAAAQAQSNSDRTFNLDVAKARKLDPVTGKPLSTASDVKPLTQADNNKVTDHIQQVVALINGSPAFENPPKGSPVGTKGPKLTPDRIRQHLLSGSNPLGTPVPADILGAAWALSKYGIGHLKEPDIRALGARGVRVPKEWMPPQFPAPGFAPEITRSYPRR